MSYVRQYLAEMEQITELLDVQAVESLVELVVSTRERQGRVFFVGVGGGAGNASHAVADFRKLAGIESYTPMDNVSELTAQINDSGWESSLVNWLQESRLKAEDLVFVFSVGGGSLPFGISVNLVRALQYAQQVGASIAGVVGRDGGYTAEVADACVVIPTVNPDTVTPHTEAFQGAIWHLLVSHPALQQSPMKWESQVGSGHEARSVLDGESVG